MQDHANTAARLPLAGIRVLDFTTLLPGPLATLMLADAGASVVKIESPAGGDRGRGNVPRDGDESIQFALLNRGKKSLALNLKSDEGRAAVLRLVQQADVLVEQFRPGVMARLGLGYEALSAINPRLIYCSITGYGQTGPMADAAGHDMNYVARSGMLSLSVGADGHPVLPAGAVADVGGGSLPAALNIFLALFHRQSTGKGCQLDVAMAESTLAWMPRALSPGLLGLPTPPANQGRHTGGSPRYGIYVAADGVPLAAAPLEPHFWRRFCELIGLSPEQSDDSVDPQGVRQRVRARIAEYSAAHWLALFEGEDVCVTPIQTPAQALIDPHFTARGIWKRELQLHNGKTYPALPVPLSPHLVDPKPSGYPALGQHRADDPDLWKRVNCEETTCR